MDVGGFNGGGDRYGMELAMAVNPERYQVTVCAMFRYGTEIERSWGTRLQSRKINYFFAANWGNSPHLRDYLQAVSSLKSQVHQRQIDICHSHFHFGTMAALYLKLISSHLIVIHTSHLKPDGVPGFYSLLRRWTFLNWIYPAYLDAETGVSKEIASIRSTAPGARWFKRKTVYIPNAISKLSDQPAADPNFPDLPENGPVLGSVGRLTEQKGYAYLIQAMPEVLRSFPLAYLVLIGDGELSDSLADMAKRLEIADHIRFLGKRNDVSRIIPMMDLFILPSLWEGLPTVIMEGMQRGVPIIATDISGTRELITDQINGLLVPPRNPSALAEAILFALKHPQATRQMAEAGLETSQAFTIEQVAKKFELLYEELIKSRGKE